MKEIKATGLREGKGAPVKKCFAFFGKEGQKKQRLNNNKDSHVRLR